MDIDHALPLTGFSLCIFQEEQWDTCSGCEKAFQEGERMYYDRRHYQAGDYDLYCAACVIEKASAY